uniref:Uncharacterized protein n=1 Tax=Rhizophora mucronata TaxID=61149 RepID=A0A2P2Q0D8_RHIMU
MIFILLEMTPNNLCQKHISIINGMHQVAKGWYTLFCNIFA